MRYILLILSTVFLFGLANPANAQTDSTKTDPVKMKIIKNDGAIYTGYILLDDGREVTINTDEVGKLILPKHMIKSISKLEDEKEISEDIEVEKTDEGPEIADSSQVEDPLEQFIEEEEEYENYTSTKYIQSDNAYPLRKGESFLKIMPVGIEAQIPLTKNWTLGAVSTYMGAPVGIKSKFSFPLKDSTFLAWEINYGTMAFGSFMDLGARNGGGYSALTYTFGNRKTNFSAKVGYALIHQYWEDWVWDGINEAPVFGDGGMAYNQFAFANFGTMIQIRDGLSIVADVMGAYGEVTSWGERYSTFLASASIAARFGPNPRHRFQLGGSLFVYDGFFVPVPIPNLSYTFVFRKRNP